MEREVLPSTSPSPRLRGAGSLVLLFGLAAAACGEASAASAAVTVYRCIDPEGRVALQDQPCAPGEETGRRDVAPTADSAPMPAPPPAAMPPQNMLPDTPPLRPPPRGVVPGLWRCVDFDGKERYATHEDRRGRYVPLWVVRGATGVAGVAGHAGQPLPGHGPPPSGTPPPGSGTAMVYVEDDCVPLPPYELCRIYRDQRDEAARRRFSRTGDERRQLDAEIERLEAILDGPCG